MAYWLFKSEPQTFSIDALKKRPHQTEHWDGVRNYQVRNMLRDDIQIGDLGFFYHSSCDVPGIVGTVKVVKKGYPDFSAWDPRSKYYDPKSSRDKPRWWMVDIKLVDIFPEIITLRAIKDHPELKTMFITRKGNRLSITPVSEKEWKIIMAMAKTGIK